MNKTIPVLGKLTIEKYTDYNKKHSKGSAKRFEVLREGDTNHVTSISCEQIKTFG